MEEPTDAERLWSNVYGHLDETGGSINALQDALEEAIDRAHHPEVHRERLESIDENLQAAFNLMDSDDPDQPNEVLDLVEYAEWVAGEFVDELDESMAECELSDDVDSGVYGTLGEYADYVYRDLIRVRTTAEEWAYAAQEETDQ